MHCMVKYERIRVRWLLYLSPSILFNHAISGYLHQFYTDVYNNGNEEIGKPAYPHLAKRFCTSSCMRKKNQISTKSDANITGYDAKYYENQDASHWHVIDF